MKRRYPGGFVLGIALGTILRVGAAFGAEVACTETTAAIPDVSLKEIARGLREPVGLTPSGDGSGRLFVVEQGGTIRMIERGRLLPDPFLDLRHKVENGGEKGLLGLAFHPRYRENGFFYVNYTTREAGRLFTHVSRFQRRTSHRADPGSEQVLLKIRQPYGNHNGGQVLFGPDGYLYVGMGDAGKGVSRGCNPKVI